MNNDQFINIFANITGQLSSSNIKIRPILNFSCLLFDNLLLTIMIAENKASPQTKGTTHSCVVQNPKAEKQTITVDTILQELGSDPHRISSVKSLQPLENQVHVTTERQQLRKVQKIVSEQKNNKSASPQQQSEESCLCCSNFCSYFQDWFKKKEENKEIQNANEGQKQLKNMTEIKQQPPQGFIRKQSIDFQHDTIYDKAETERNFPDVRVSKQHKAIPKKSSQNTGSKGDSQFRHTITSAPKTVKTQNVKYNNKDAQSDKKYNESIEIASEQVHEITVFNNKDGNSRSFISQAKKLLQTQSSVENVSSECLSNRYSYQLSKVNSQEKPSNFSHFYFCAQKNEEDSKAALLYCTTEFKDLLFRNHAKFINYLSANKNQLKYTARHYFIDPSEIERKEDQNYKSFKLKMEKGMASFVPKKGEDYLQLLYDAGDKQIYLWFLCIVKGVIELQKLGIFHPDICLRNTIKVKNMDKQELPFEHIYKIIDFDYAFKVAKAEEEKEKKLYAETKKIVKQWLSLEENRQDIMNYLFSYIKGKRKMNQSIFPHFSQVRDIVIQPRPYQHLQNSAQDIMALFHLYSLFYHKKQLLELCEEHLFRENKSEESQKILEQLRNIPIQNVKENLEGYEQLVKTLNKIINIP